MPQKTGHKKKPALAAGEKAPGVFAAHRQVWLTAAVVAVMLVMLTAFFVRNAATDPAAIPLPAHFLEDQAGLVSPWFVGAKNQYIQYLSRTLRVAQIRVLTLPSVPSGALEDFTIRAATQWKVGSNGVDNGLLLFIFRDERKIRLEVGYDLESVVPDALAYKLLEEQLVPAFAQGQFEVGIENYLDALKKTLEASGADNHRAAPYARLIPFVISVLRAAPQAATTVRRAFIAADTQGRIVLSLEGLALVSILGALLVSIANGIPALLVLPWRMYKSQNLRILGTPAVREQFRLKNSATRAPPIVVEIATELELEKIFLSLSLLGATIAGIAFLFVDFDALVGGLGHYSGAGATLSWP